MSEKKKILVRVSASFSEGQQLFEWLKKYGKQVDDRFVYWDEFIFTTDELSTCDALLIFNNPSQKIEVKCFPEAVIAFMMEPGVLSENPWMFRRLDQYANVYSPINRSANTVLSHGYLGWYLLQNWNELATLPVPEKNKDMSCIASGLKQLKGHRDRLAFVTLLKKEIPSIEFYGKGSNYIPDKSKGLLPYRFSVAIENSSSAYYFTEKINDCFLCYTVPVYFGCSGIGKYFPSASFIEIDINRPAQAIERIREIQDVNDWQSRLGALQEARELVLNKYQPLAGAADILRQTRHAQKQTILLDPVPETTIRKLKNYVNSVKAKI
ncbi:MAG TPA: glycosyltransferase family 10 [Ferruginibacter sp.]|nr:glycosyltransferase family 10 [Ferruginibacter sp.]